LSGRNHYFSFLKKKWNTLVVLATEGCDVNASYLSKRQDAVFAGVLTVSVVDAVALLATAVIDKRGTLQLENA
jgi:hypothetical protein